MKIPKKYIHQSGPQKGKINLRLVQTNLKALQRGDCHPTIEGLVFIRYRTDRGGLEHWNTTEFRQNFNAISNDRTRKWRENNPEKFKASWKSAHAKRLVSGKQAEYESRPKTKALRKKAVYRWKERHPKRAKEAERKSNKNWKEKHFKNWLETGDNHLKVNLRACISTAVKKQYTKKAYKSMGLLGCTIEDVRDHLEFQFTEGMTWDNMGRGGWHIDHIIPCAFFDLTKPNHQKVCFNYQNLQPLWESDNCSKGDKIHWSIVWVLILNNYKSIGVNK